MNCLIRIRQRYPDRAKRQETGGLSARATGYGAASELAATGGRSGRQPIQRSQVRAKTGV